MQSGGDVSPGTKRRNYKNLRMASAGDRVGGGGGKVCKRCIPRFAPFPAVSLRVFPWWGSRGVGGAPGSRGSQHIPPRKGPHPALREMGDVG